MDAYEFNLKHQARVPGVISIRHVIRSFIYDAEGRPIYIGYAFRGSSKASAVWTVERIDYNPDGTVNDPRISPDNQIFNDYASLTYA